MCEKNFVELKALRNCFFRNMCVLKFLNQKAYGQAIIHALLYFIVLSVRFVFSDRLFPQ